MEPSLTDPARAKQWLGCAVGLAVLVQLTLFATATAPGLAGTSDSIYYLHAAQTLRDSGRLLNPDGTAYRYWPPLYPMLLRACGSLAAIRVLHGACLLGSLLLWSWLGARLLPARRALVLPMLLALSTPWLLVSKFIWAESGFLLLFAAYAVLLFQWLRTGRGSWWAAATAVGFVLPMQRTLGVFLLAGIGVELLLGGWRWLPIRKSLLVALHLVISVVGGLVWQWYALLMAGPSRYHPSRGWGALLSSLADYGFVLGRWLLPLPTAGRTLLPHAVWAAVLLLLFGLLWPRRPLEVRSTKLSVELVSTEMPNQLMLQMLWGVSVTLITLVAMLTIFAQSAAGIHDTERYASILFAPVLLLVLVAWPAQAPRWLGRALVAMWLLCAALRAGHVAMDLRRLKPLTPDSFAGPWLHGQRVGAAGE